MLVEYDVLTLYIYMHISVGIIYNISFVELCKKK